MKRAIFFALTASAALAAFLFARSEIVDLRASAALAEQTLTYMNEALSDTLRIVRNENGTLESATLLFIGQLHDLELENRRLAARLSACVESSDTPAAGAGVVWDTSAGVEASLVYAPLLRRGNGSALWGVIRGSWRASSRPKPLL